MLRKNSAAMLGFSCALFAAAMFAFASTLRANQDVTAQAPQYISSNAVSTSDMAYTEKIFGIYDGRVAVFTSEKAQPIRLLEKKVDSLPQETADKLRSGIVAKTYDQYVSYLEDFS